MKPLSQQERHEIQGVINDHKDSCIREIDAIDPEWRRRVEERKNKVAIGQLKVEKEVLELNTLEEQIRALQAKRDEIELRIRKKMPLEPRSGRGGCPDRQSLCEAVAGVCRAIHNAEMKKDASGKVVLGYEESCRVRFAKLAACATREDVVAAKIIN